MALSTERLGLYNPEKPMENRLTDLGPRHFWQYFPPIIQNNYGKWKDRRSKRAVEGSCRGADWKQETQARRQGRPGDRQGQTDRGEDSR